MGNHRFNQTHLVKQNLDGPWMIPAGIAHSSQSNGGSQIQPTRPIAPKGASSRKEKVHTIE